MSVKGWKKISVNLAQVKEEDLQEFINVIDDAIVYLNNHHYDTSKLIMSTRKLLGTSKPEVE